MLWKSKKASWTSIIVGWKSWITTYNSQKIPIFIWSFLLCCERLHKRQSKRRSWKQGQWTHPLMLYNLLLARSLVLIYYQDTKNQHHFSHMTAARCTQNTKAPLEGSCRPQGRLRGACRQYQTSSCLCASGGLFFLLDQGWPAGTLVIYNSIVWEIRLFSLKRRKYNPCSRCRILPTEWYFRQVFWSSPIHNPNRFFVQLAEGPQYLFGTDSSLLSGIESDLCISQNHLIPIIP